MATEPPVLSVDKSLGPDAKFNWSSPEHPDDRKHRHTIELILTVAGLVLVAAILVLGAVMVFRGPNDEVQEGGIGLLSAVLGGVLGFMAGRGSK